MGGVDAAGQVAGRRIVGHYPGLIVVVMILAVAVVEAGGPGVAEPVFGIQLREVGITVGNIKRFIKTRFAIDIHRMTGVQIEDGAAIEWGTVVTVRIGDVHRCPLAEPG